jgi:Tol biopolymer transport system component
MRLFSMLVLAALVALAFWVLSRMPDHVVEDLENLPSRAVTRWLPPQAGELQNLNELEQAALSELAGNLNARIVWSSNRDGNHELYLLDVERMEVQRLTDNPRVDFFSRFSPDGSQIVFTRSQREWVSFRDTDPWDIYLINSDGSGERLLARHGYHPTWTRDGQGIVFLRGQEVIRIDIATGEEALLFSPPGDFPGSWFGDPELSPEGGRLAMGIGNFAASVVDLSTGDVIPLGSEQGCQTTWTPAGDSVVWIETAGNGGTRVARTWADGSKGDVLMDLPGDYSHEYFPNLSDDGRWLVWGAAAEGHEHDRADYEIFVWRIGTPWEEAVRLTYYTGNDQWPDIHIDPPPAPSSDRTSRPS